MAQSIKLADDIMKIVRRESELQSRSIAGQIAHWVRIGRAIEKSGNFDHARITAAPTAESTIRYLSLADSANVRAPGSRYRVHSPFCSPTPLAAKVIPESVVLTFTSKSEAS